MEYYLFSKILKEKRIKKGLYQKDVAQILKISTSKYNKIENGSIEPSFKELYTLCKMFNIDILKFENNIKNNKFKYYD